MFASRLLGKNWLSVIRLKRAEIRAQLHGDKIVNGINFDRIQAIKQLKQKHTKVFKS